MFPNPISFIGRCATVLLFAATAKYASRRAFHGCYGSGAVHELLTRIKRREAALLAKGGAVMMPEPAEPSHRMNDCIRRDQNDSAARDGGNLDSGTWSPAVLCICGYVEGGLFSTGDAHFAQGDGSPAHCNRNVGRSSREIRTAEG